MPKHYFEEFPVEVAAMLNKLCYKRNVKKNQLPKLERGDLLIRLKGCSDVKKLAMQRVLAVWAKAKRTKESTERRPVVTLRLLGKYEKPCGPNTAKSENLINFIMDAITG